MTAPEVTVTVNLEMPNQQHLFEHIKANAKYGHQVIAPPNGWAGKRLVICGAGPSIAAQHDAIRKTPAHQVWGCNSALPYLKDHGLPVTHGVTVDMSEEMLSDPNEWQRTFPVTYLVSSGVHPKLIPHLRKANRTVRLFHSYLGLPSPEGWTPDPAWAAPKDFTGQDAQFRTYEMELYTHLYPATVQVGYGLNTVPRAICLALWMGFKTVTVFGADCAVAPDAAPMPPTDDVGYVPWLKTLKLYPDGRSDPTQSTPAKYGDNAIMTQGMILGRLWHTRPDMLVSAKHLVDLVGLYPDRLRLVGDTLPNAILSLSPEERAAYLKMIPTLNGKGAVAGFGVNTPLDTEKGATL